MFGLSTFGPYVVAGAVLHAASRKLLLWKLLWDKECRGVSLISQVSLHNLHGQVSRQTQRWLQAAKEAAGRHAATYMCVYVARYMAKTVHPCHDRFPCTLLYLKSYGRACMWQFTPCHDHTPCALLTLHPALPQELWLCVYVARYMDLLYLFESFGVELIKVRHTGQLSGVHTHLVGQCWRCTWSHIRYIHHV